MTRSSPTPNQPRRQTLAAEIELLQRRVAATEHTQDLLRNTVVALARESGQTVGSPCSRCDQSYVLITDGMLYCPTCRDRRTL